MGNYKNEIRKYLKYATRFNFEYTINISLQHKYVYVETPKVGCSTIKDTLQRMELNFPDLVREDANDIHDRKYSPLLSPSQTCGFDRLLSNSDYFIFCFVRNPYTRLLSAYLDKIVNGSPHKKSILIAMGEDPSNLDKEITFSEFVDVVCDLPIIDMDVHWRPQYYQTFNDLINFDFIGRMESFEVDCNHVFSKIRDDYADYYRAEVRHATQSTDQVSRYYDEGLKEKVFNKYKVDFEYFGYHGELSSI